MTVRKAAAYVSPVEAADELGCSHATILRAIRRGDLAAFTYGTRLFRIRRDVFDAWVAANTTSAVSPLRQRRSA